ncbi:MAG: helix-turn-helix domain-containing protein [Rhodoglobus sp.]
MLLEVPGSRAQRPPAPAKLRILATADRLFYADGIRTVGIDRLIGESSVTKATFYKHYRSKDNLIVDYVTSRHNADIAALDAAIAEAPNAEAAVRHLAATIAAEVSRAGYRGDPFLNAASEFSDPAHPVRIIVAEHRDAYTERLATLAKAIGHSAPGDAADELMLAKDGAMSGGYAGDPVAATAAFGRVVDRVIAGARG